MAAREEKTDKKEKAKFGQKGTQEPKDKPKGRPVQKIEVKKTGKETENFRGIIRVVGKDIKGHVAVKHALRQVPGVGHNLSASLLDLVLKKADFGPDELVGNLSDQQLGLFEDVIKNPAQNGVPAFLLNRPIDPESGNAMHRVMADLRFSVKTDIDKHKEMRSYRGWRHQIGQKTRGQRTRSTGRTGMSVGVLKKTAGKPAAPAPEKK